MTRSGWSLSGPRARLTWPESALGRRARADPSFGKMKRFRSCLGLWEPLHRPGLSWVMKERGWEVRSQKDRRTKKRLQKELEEKSLSRKSRADGRRQTRKWLSLLDEHLHSLPERTLEVQEPPEEEKWYDAESTSEESVSFHEFGVEWQDTEEDSEEEEMPMKPMWSTWASMRRGRLGIMWMWWRKSMRRRQRGRKSKRGRRVGRRARQWHFPNGTS